MLFTLSSIAKIPLVSLGLQAAWRNFGIVSLTFQTVKAKLSFDKEAGGLWHIATEDAGDSAAISQNMPQNIEKFS